MRGMGKKDGKIVSSISAGAFSISIYDSLHWKKEFSFKFRGITKERGKSKILVFSLDEPQIIVGKKYRNHSDIEKESTQPFGFVKYKTDADQEKELESSNIMILVFEMEEAIMFAPKKEEFGDSVTGEIKKRQVKYYQDTYKNKIGRSYTEYEQYRQMNLFEDFGAYNKEGKDGPTDLLEENSIEESQIEKSIEGTEAPQGAAVPAYDAEKPVRNDINSQEGDDDNGSNKENTSTNLSITGQMGFH